MKCDCKSTFVDPQCPLANSEQYNAHRAAIRATKRKQAAHRAAYGYGTQTAPSAEPGYRYPPNNLLG